MKITSLFSRERPTLSFEVFPPKNGDNYDSVEYSVSRIAKLNPDFMSVTHRAGELQNTPCPLLRQFSTMAFCLWPI